MAATTPPVLVAASTSLVAKLRGAKFVYHNQDLYPEIVGADKHGYVSGRIARAVLGLDASTGRRSERIVVLSRDMALAWRRRGIGPGSVVEINNFQPGLPTESNHADTAGRPSPTTAPVRVMFAGNLGPFQGLTSIARELSMIPDVEFLLAGDGSHTDEVIEAAGPHVQYYGRLAPEATLNRVRHADLGLVTLTPGTIRYAFPSKTHTYLSVGTPIIAAVEEDSELAETLVKRGMGYVIDPESGAGLRESIIRYKNLAEHERIAMRRRCVEFSREFSEHSQLERWAALFRELMHGTPV